MQYSINLRHLEKSEDNLKFGLHFKQEREVFRKEVGEAYSSQNGMSGKHLRESEERINPEEHF
jgi:hypothetical protein